MRASNSESTISNEMLVLAPGGCAEHEMGIEQMRLTLGVPGDPSPISEVLRGTASASHWPTTAEDFRVADSSEVLFFEMQLRLPASLVRRVASYKSSRVNPRRLACAAYLEAMTADGKKRVPSVTLSFGVLALLSYWAKEDLYRTLRLSAEQAAEPLLVSRSQFVSILQSMTGGEVYLPNAEDLLADELLRQGYGPELSEEQRASTLSTLRPRAAWDQRHFCIMGTGDDVAHPRDFAQAFREGRVFCGLQSKANPFARPGLAFVHERAVTDELREHVRQQWAAQRKLLERVQATGIMAKLKASNKRFFALNPRLDEDGELTFWLNPFEQNRYHYGWMSLQDLQDWADNKGRVVKQVG